MKTRQSSCPVLRGGGYPYTVWGGNPLHPPVDRHMPVKTLPSRRTTYAGGNPPPPPPRPTHTQD